MHCKAVFKKKSATFICTRHCNLVRSHIGHRGNWILTPYLHKCAGMKVTILSTGWAINYTLSEEQMNVSIISRNLCKLCLFPSPSIVFLIPILHSPVPPKSASGPCHWSGRSIWLQGCTFWPLSYFFLSSGFFKTSYAVRISLNRCLAWSCVCASFSPRCTQMGKRGWTLTVN